MSEYLFTPYRMGNLLLPNRIVMAPMTRSRAIANLPNELMARYYALRASAGLIITEGTAPSRNGLGYARIPALFSPRHVRAWKDVTDAVHRAGGRMFVQLMHTGRIAHPLNLPQGARILAPSALAAAGSMWTDQQGMQEHPVPQAMTAEDIAAFVAEYVQSAQFALDAGFDGVELHGANGYLLNQFANARSNVRDDAYGGSVEKRLRVPLLVVEAVAKAIGAERVGYRASPFGQFNDMGTEHEAEMFDALARGLGQQRIAYLHLINPAPAFAAQFQGLLGQVRSQFGGTLILAGGYDHGRGEAALGAGQTDLVAFGTPFLANPDFVHKLRDELPLLAHDPATVYTPGEKGYLDYPLTAAAARAAGNGLHAAS